MLGYTFCVVFKTVFRFIVSEMLALFQGVLLLDYCSYLTFLIAGFLLNAISLIVTECGY